MIYMKTGDVSDNSIFSYILEGHGFSKQNNDERRINICMK